jgi:hypothetical protein
LFFFAAWPILGADEKNRNDDEEGYRCQCEVVEDHGSTPVTALEVD